MLYVTNHLKLYLYHMVLSLAAALDLVRVEMEKEYTARRQQHEQRLRSVQLERQAVFQAAFQEDLRSYQQLGTVPSEYSV